MSGCTDGTEQSHSIFVGDKIERAIEIIGEESDDVDKWELLSDYTHDDIQPKVELRGNYLHVSVDTETDRPGGST
ncbi:MULTISPECIES: hypothetical protein [Bacillati]|uniref:Uncharacterized protein n=3 Tax=Bacillati TaxID=1783272 RepID=A0ABP6HDW6_9ACTN